MRILLLNLPGPPGYCLRRDHSGGFGYAVHSGKGAKFDVYPPLFEAYAAAVLEMKGYEVTILDGQAENLVRSQLLEETEKQNPEIIVCRVSLPSYEYDIEAISKIREKLPDAFFIGWGALSKFKPEEVLASSELDVVIRDVELEFPLLDTVEALSRKDTMETVAGVSFKTGTGIVHNPDRPPSKNLDMLPLPAYHLLKMKRYVALESHYFPGGSKDKFIPFFFVCGSRGCSFNCIYCPYPATFKRWKGRDPKKVVDEMEYVVDNYGIQAISFSDQTFTMSPKRAMIICDEILKRGIDVHWACETRADKLPAPLVKKMKKAGCARIQIGIETGDPQLLKILAKPGCSIEQVEKTIRVAQKEAILIDANLMVGLPGESWKTIENTARFLKRINPDILSITIATPYPGTRLYEMAEQNNWLLTKDWKKYTLFEPVMSMPRFTDQDMKKALHYLYDETVLKRKLRRIVKEAHGWRFGSIAKELILNLHKVPVHAYRSIRRRLGSS